MKSIYGRLRAYSIRLCWLLALGACSPDVESGYVPPAPHLAPEEVVQMQLAALRQAGGDTPEARLAMAAAYAFASPRNKAAVGSVEDFGNMILDSYADMIAHSRAVVSVVEQNESEAAISVILLMPSDKPQNYMFLLQKQSEGDCVNCWMTDAVLVLAPDNPAALQAI